MGDDNIHVCLRVRPRNEKEMENEPEIALSFPSKTSVKVISTQHVFDFDRVFPLETKQVEVFEYGAKRIITDVMQGYNGTVFAYGQTASGKTFTMEGIIDDPELQGIMPRMVWTIFDGIYNADDHIEFLVKVSLVEIYQERIRDLLDPSKDNLKIHEDKARGVFLSDITESYVQSEQEIFDAIRVGNVNRTTAATEMNAHSSRSHLVFILTVEQKNLTDRTVKSGKLYLVDLAGSEKIAKTKVQGVGLDEAKGINKSLSALGNVIMALTEGKPHIPYRDSKLTRMLQESLGGNAKTALIITCSPSVYNEAETISTLRFGQRAKLIQNKAHVNEEKSAEELKILLEREQREKKRLALRIEQLEELLQQNGIEVPAFDITKARKAKASKLGGGDAESVDDVSSIDDDAKDDKRQLDEALKQTRAYEEKIAADEQKIADMEKEKETLAYDKDELSLSIEKMKADHASQRGELESLKIDRKQLKEKIAELEKDGKRAEHTGEAGDAGTKNVLDELRANQQAKVKIQGDMSAVQKEYDNIREKIKSENWEENRVELLETLEKQEMRLKKLDALLLREAEKNESLQEKLKEGDKPLKRKVSQLDKNLEQLTVMYHKLVSQNSGLKVESQVNEKKINRKEQRIQQLERNLREAKVKYEKLLTQCTNLTAAMDIMGKARHGVDRDRVIRRAASNIIRPLKGGDRRNSHRAESPKPVGQDVARPADSPIIFPIPENDKSPSTAYRIVPDKGDAPDKDMKVTDPKHPNDLERLFEKRSGEPEEATHKQDSSPTSTSPPEG